MNKQDLIDLATFRKIVATQTEVCKTNQSNLELTPAYVRLTESKDALKEYNAKVDELTEKIKAEALAEYIATKAAPALHGLALCVNHPLKYNIAKVTEWAKENAKVLFKFDVKEFEKMASKVDVPGVEKIDDPTITIASDLSEYLAESQSEEA